MSEIKVTTQHRPTGVIQVDVFPDEDMSPEHVARDLWEQIKAWVNTGYQPVIEVTLADDEGNDTIHRVDLGAEKATCKHCSRAIVDSDDGWVDPEATGDDVIWRATCDAHDTRTAEHEPER